ncbi:MULTISPECIES: hypothetical protein [unclassified Chryseobacterium]|uniref:hypothetical protein n=1 Tax=unclassified Chryseobacterium TaxID=2593645 RepID=UPI000D3D4AA6|nr:MULTISPECIES: hypothetical protein [unclassified Chryseobacterium]PTT71783.1 hypothetical protein DBR25_16015 [Chryseobacterium sp. HMWF001]PVV55046.1 hypothetical protein DD829_16035 [Chryseobacterium sp. HMWF035]
MRNIFSFILLLSFFVAFGQKEDSLALNKIIKIEDSLLNKIIYETDTVSLNSKSIIHIQNEILLRYNQFVLDYPNSEYLFAAFLGKASKEQGLHQYNDAKKSYLFCLKLIEDQKIGKEHDNQSLNSYLNQIYQSLADIELENNNFTEAIKFLDKANEHPFQPFCGNANAMEHILIAEKYSKSYIGLKENEKALNILIPLLIENGLADNSEIIKQAYDLLLKNNTKEDLKIKFEKAFKNLISEKKMNGTYKYTVYSIKFLDRNVTLPYWKLYDATTEKDREKIVKSILKNSKFYALLIN